MSTTTSAIRALSIMLLNAEDMPSDLDTLRPILTPEAWTLLCRELEVCPEHFQPIECCVDEGAACQFPWLHDAAADPNITAVEEVAADKFRGYVVGLPVAVSINDDAFVRVEVDLSELSWGIVKDSDTSTLQVTTDEQLRADAEVLSRWVSNHDVMNEDHAPTADEVTA
jgi:hypothetical protein